MQSQNLTVPPLTFVDEGDDVVVGSIATDSYAVLPHDAAAALRRLESGATPTEVSEWYAQEYGEALDIDDYVESLIALGLARLNGSPAAPEPRPVRLQWLARIALGPVTLAGYALLCLVALVVMVRDPHFAPRPSHIFFTSSVLAVELVAMFAQIPLLLAHEGFHALAARRLGLPSTLGMSRRLYFIVFETRMIGLLGVARRRRYLCFLAGMIIDLVFIAGFTLLGYALRNAGGTPGLVGRLALALVFPVCVRTAYQFVFFLQTDLYYVISTAFRCYDLHNASKAIVHNWMAGLRRRSDRQVDLENWTDQDVAKARIYAPLSVLGSVVLVSIWLYAFAPILWTMLRDVVITLSSGPGVSHYWDRIGFVTLNGAQVVLLLVVSRHDRRVAAGTAAIKSTTTEGVSR